MSGQTETLSRHTFPFAQIPHALIEDPELSHSAVRVYCYLMRRADNATGNAFPGIRLIAKEIGMAPGTVTKGIADLDERGWIDVQKRYTKKKQHLANDYLVRTTQRGVAEIGTPVVVVGTGGVAESVTELDPVLTTTSELDLATRNVAWDFLTDPNGFNLPDTTKKQQKRVGALAREINATLEANETDDPMAALQRAALSWPLHFETATLTPDAFEKHLPALLTSPLRGNKTLIQQSERDMQAAWVKAQIAEREANPLPPDHPSEVAKRRRR